MLHRLSLWSFLDTTAYFKALMKLCDELEARITNDAEVSRQLLEAVLNEALHGHDAASATSPINFIASRHHQNEERLAGQGGTRLRNENSLILWLTHDGENSPKTNDSDQAEADGH
jgi:hypothetical protein